MTTEEVKKAVTEQVEPTKTNGDDVKTTDDLNQKIVRQIEFYFGDINLPRDKFLQEEMKKNEGWISLTTMLKFNRLAKLSDDTKVIADALKDSDLIEVNDDKTQIRRSPEVPLPENTLEYWQEIKRRTVYMKGFDSETTLDEIQKLVFPHGKVQNILMRRFKKEKTFKGSVFVTFSDVDTAQKFANDKELLIFNEKPLEKMMQDDYWSKKAKENKEKREEHKKAKQAKRLEQMAEQEKNVLSARFLKGVVLEVTGFDSKQTKYEELKTYFKNYGPVAFVAYEQGDDTARVRFGGDQENAAKTAWTAAIEKGNGKAIFKDHELTATVLEGEEEEKYWAEFTKTKVAKRDQAQKNSNNQKKSARGYKAKKRHHQGGDVLEQKAKHTKFEEEDEESEA